jgi:hypothetical protein
MQIKCDICELMFEEAQITRVTPASYLGTGYPSITSFCPECFLKFLRKAQAIYGNQEAQKISNLKDFVNS